MDFRAFCRDYFFRLCRGYAGALDDTLVRGWLGGHKTAGDAGGCLDMSSRMFPALAAWLADAERPRVIEVRGRRVDIEALVRAVLERAFDPEAPGFWGCEEFPPVDQRTVESSAIGYGAWLLRDSILPTITPRARQCLASWLDRFASGEPWKNNWHLFRIVNHAARKALGWSFSQEGIDGSWVFINSLDRGDGWMTDGPEGHFDDYNWWVLGLHELWWMQMDGANDPQQVQRVEERTRRRLEDYPYFFGAEGSYCEYGRSLAYKFARLGLPLLAYKMGLWPHSAGMLKRIVRLHLAHYDNMGAIDRRTDTVRQTLSEFGHAAVRERYINTGHPYWCMQAFASLWQIADDDAIWTAEEEPLPVERGDFSRVVRPAGWVLRGTKAGGQVIRYSLGTRHGSGESAAKYGKFTYSSHFPFNAGAAEGDFGPDSALCITDGTNWTHTGVFDKFAVDERWLRATYELRVGACVVPCETVIAILNGTESVRIHRLRTPAGNPAMTVWEGAAALGYAPGIVPKKRVDPIAQISAAEVTLAAGMARTSLIQGLRGYTCAHRPQAFRGREDLNAVHALAITPLLEAAIPAGFGRELILACRTVSALQAVEPAPADIRLQWTDEGNISVRAGNETVDVPPL